MRLHLIDTFRIQDDMNKNFKKYKFLFKSLYVSNSILGLISPFSNKKSTKSGLKFETPASRTYPELSDKILRSFLKILKNFDKSFQNVFD